MFILLFFYTSSASAETEFVESVKPYNYKNGLLDDSYIIKSNNIPAVLYDNDASLRFTNFANAATYINFNKPVDIKSFYLKALSNGGILVITFEDLNGKKNEFSTTNNGVLNNRYHTVDFKNIVRISLHKIAQGRLDFYEIDFFGTYEIQAVQKVYDLTAKTTSTSAVLSWINPDDDDFIGVKILKNGKEVESLSKDYEKYEITKLLPDTDYSYDVVALYKNEISSSPSNVKFKTLEAQKVGEVIDLSALVKYNRVDLSWKNPSADNFKHVNIYRDRIIKKGLLDFLKVKQVNAATKIFETNGTYFNDLTVQEEFTYEYLVTTESTEKIESDGVKKTVTIPINPNPEPEIDGEETEVDEDGNYTFSWTKPTNGKVKVLVGGKEYAIVNASDFKIIIPAKDMKFTMFGDPDVKLIPIDEDGNEGKPTEPPTPPGSGGIGNVELPFTPKEIILGIFGFISIMGGFILLYLMIRLIPRLIKIIRDTNQKRQHTGKDTGRRTG